MQTFYVTRLSLRFSFVVKVHPLSENLETPETCPRQIIANKETRLSIRKTWLKRSFYTFIDGVVLQIRYISTDLRISLL